MNTYGNAWTGNKRRAGGHVCDDRVRFVSILEMVQIKSNVDQNDVCQQTLLVLVNLSFEWHYLPFHKHQHLKMMLSPAILVDLDFVLFLV